MESHFSSVAPLIHPLSSCPQSLRMSVMFADIIDMFPLFWAISYSSDGQLASDNEEEEENETAMLINISSIPEYAWHPPWQQLISLSCPYIISPTHQPSDRLVWFYWQIPMSFASSEQSKQRMKLPLVKCGLPYLQLEMTWFYKATRLIISHFTR